MTSLGGYALAGLNELGAQEFFSVPGDYHPGFFSQIPQDPIQLVKNCSEMNVGKAAYKRRDYEFS